MYDSMYFSSSENKIKCEQIPKRVTKVPLDPAKRVFSPEIYTSTQFSHRTLAEGSNFLEIWAAKNTGKKGTVTCMWLVANKEKNYASVVI